MNKKNNNYTSNNNCYVTDKIDYSVLIKKKESKYCNCDIKKKTLKIKLGAKASDDKNISLYKSNKLNSKCSKSNESLQVLGGWTYILRKDIRNKKHGL